MLSPTRHHRRNLTIYLFYCIICIIWTAAVSRAAGDLWPLDRPSGMPSIQSLDVMCGKDHMDVHLTFSQPFEGIVSSKGQHGDPRCVYVPPSTGQTFFSFRIAYARCGTKPDLHGQFYENTVVVQYDKDLLEVWDEAKRLRCEWFNDYEKTATKPPMVIADLDVIQLDFRGDNVDCWMEIQHGKGPWAPPVTGIVPLGSTLTLVVAINDYRGEFDMRVKSCAASDGGGHIIQLSDEFGCVLRPKMISRFLKAKGADERASVITYAFFHAFKFPDALSVHIKCKVEICRHGCLDHCQQQPEHEGTLSSNPHDYVGPTIDRTDHRIDSEEEEDKVKSPDPKEDDQSAQESLQDILYEDPDEEKYPLPKLPVHGQADSPHSSPLHYPKETDPERHSEESLDVTAVPHKDLQPQDKFPHGPRTFDREIPPAAPRSFPEVSSNPEDSTPQSANNSKKPFDHSKRKKRSVVISDRKVRSADVGVSSLYEVISEADLAFSPDGKAEAVTVFQGRIREEVVYGICMPVPGFSVLFVLVAVSAVVSALVAGTLLYRYQLQKEQLVEEAHRSTRINPWHWVAFLWMRHHGEGESIQMRETNGSVDGSVVLNGKSEDSLHRE